MTEKRGRGQPAYRPTVAQRQDVRLFKADGWSDDRIARRLGISRTTLLKHFAEELENGADQERQEALRLLKRAARKLNVTAIRDLLKLIGAGSAIDEFLRQPERGARQPKLGKKEIAREEALRAHENSDWGDDLPAPLADTRTIN